MRNSQHPWTRGAAWLITGIVCWCCALGALTTREALWNKSRLSHRNPNATATAESIKKLRKVIEKEQGGLVAGWGQQLSQSISVAELDGSATVDVLWIEGDAALVWDVRVIAGNLPKQGDTQGCALDQPTALSLFGSTDIIGRTVTLAGQTLVVRGVFARPEGLSAIGADPGRGIAFAPAQAKSDLPLTALEFILYTGQENPTSQASSWMQQAGVSTGGTFNTHTDERSLMRLLMDVPAFLLCAFVLLEAYTGVRQLWKGYARGQATLKEDRLTPPRKWARLLSVFGLGVLCLLGIAALCVSQLPQMRSIPPSYMPTQWSDFAFWPNLITQALQSRAKAALTISLRPDMVFDVLTGWAAALWLACVFCLWHGRSLMRKASSVRTSPAVGCFIALCVALPASAWLTRQIGWPLTPQASLLLYPALLYAAMLFIRIEKLPAKWIAQGVRPFDNTQHIIP